MNTALLSNLLITRRHSGGGGQPSAVLSKGNSVEVDGIFDVELTLSTVADIVDSDVNVINGTCIAVHTINRKVWWLVIEPDAQGAVQVSVPSLGSNTIIIPINEDWAYIRNSGELFYDFRALSNYATYPIIGSDAGIKDKSGNNHNGVIVNSPCVRELPANYGVPGLNNRNGVASNGGVDTGDTLSTLFQNANGFSFNIRIQTSDGRPATVHNFLGSNNSGSPEGFRFQIRTGGEIDFILNTLRWRSDAAVFDDGQSDVTDIDAHFDFVNKTIVVNVNGSPVAGSIISGDIATYDPSSYSCTANIFIGTLNNNGTAQNNPVIDSSIYFVLFSALQNSERRNSLRTYLANRAQDIEVVDSLSVAGIVDFGHDVYTSRLGLDRLYFSGKGAEAGTTFNGSMAIVDISNPENISLLGYDNSANTHIDSETVEEIDANHVLEFVDKAARMWDVSNPAIPVLVKSVAVSGGVGNGCVRVGNYVFSCNKGGFIDVFDVSTPAEFTLIGSYDAKTEDGFDEPHDCDISKDNKNLIISFKGNPPNWDDSGVAVYTVFDGNGDLISPSLWTLRSKVASADDAGINGCNRVRVMGDYAFAAQHSNGYTLKLIDLSNLDSISIISTISLGASPTATRSTGLSYVFLGRYFIAGNDMGIKIIDIKNPLVEMSGCINGQHFVKLNNANVHDIDVIRKNGYWYAFVTTQAQESDHGGIIVCRINRIG